MEEQTWSFSRAAEVLHITRAEAADGFLLSITGDGPPRSYLFPLLPRLETFQADFEKFLLGTGWTFTSFSPERRTGRERRNFSRLVTDRRRWWTDGIPATGTLPEDGKRERRRRNQHHQR